MFFDEYVTSYFNDFFWCFVGFIFFSFCYKKFWFVFYKYLWMHVFHFNYMEVDFVTIMIYFLGFNDFWCCIESIIGWWYFLCGIKSHWNLGSKLLLWWSQFLCGWSEKRAFVSICGRWIGVFCGGKRKRWDW